jgi:hypothetical protein
MANTDLRVLFPPVLLATDGSPSARLAQKIVRPLVQLFQAEEQEKLPEPELKLEGESGGEAPPPTSRVVSILLMVLTVQPKVAKRMLRSGKKAVSHQILRYVWRPPSFMRGRKNELAALAAFILIVDRIEGWNKP